MKRPYSAPVCEYMTFAVDEAIASTTCSNSYKEIGGNKWNSPSTCTIYGMDGDILFGSDNGACTATTDVYCYYTSAITIFGS